MDTVQQYPPYKDAIKKFFEHHYTYGSLIKHEWFFEAFGLPVIDKGSFTKEKADKIQLQFLTNLVGFRRHLLHHHQMALASKAGVGYEVVQPQDQSKWAYNSGKRKILKALHEQTEYLTNVDFARLTAEQQRENANYLSRTSAARAMMKESEQLEPFGLHEKAALDNQ